MQQEVFDAKVTHTPNDFLYYLLDSNHTYSNNVSHMFAILFLVESTLKCIPFREQLPPYDSASKSQVFQSPVSSVVAGWVALQLRRFPSSSLSYNPHSLSSICATAHWCSHSTLFPMSDKAAHIKQLFPRQRYAVRGTWTPCHYLLWSCLKLPCRV